MEPANFSEMLRIRPVTGHVISKNELFRLDSILNSFEIAMFLQQQYL
jgi:hypothetical protein